MDKYDEAVESELRALYANVSPLMFCDAQTQIELNYGAQRIWERWNFIRKVANALEVIKTL